MSSGNDQPSSSTNPNPSNTTPPRQQGEGSNPSSNTTPPRQQGEGSNPSSNTTPNTTPPCQQGEGSNPSSPQRPRVPITPPRNPRPIMGISGVSAFHPFVRPSIQPRQIPPPPPTFPMLPPPPPPYPHAGPSSSFGPGPGSWFGFPGQYGFFGAQPLQFGGFSGSVGGLRIGGGGGGSPSSARKRVRDGAAMPGAPAPGGGNVPGAQVLDPTECSVCRKKFVSAKALFGHMRTHPGRGWRGAHPPPTFRAEEEFADLHGGNMEEAVRAVRAAAAEVAGDAIGGADHGDGGVGPAGEEEQGGGEEEGRDQGNFKVPDLNNSPPHSE